MLAHVGVLGRYSASSWRTITPFWEQSGARCPQDRPNIAQQSAKTSQDRLEDASRDSKNLTMLYNHTCELFQEMRSTTPSAENLQMISKFSSSACIAKLLHVCQAQYANPCGTSYLDSLAACFACVGETCLDSKL